MKSFLKKFSLRRTDWLIISVIVIVFLCSFLIANFLYQRIKSDIYKNKEDSAVAAGKVLTKYAVDNYELYHDSGTLKFQEIMLNINDLGEGFSNFQIIGTNKDVLYDSRNREYNAFDQKASTDLSDEVLASNDVYKKKNEEKLDYLVVPYFDDWGNHKYSLKYMVDYREVDAKTNNFKMMMVLIVMGINIIDVFILGIFSSGEKYHLEKEHAKNLIEVNALKDEFMGLVSHNLRTPLSIIRGYMSFITDPKCKPEEVEENIKDMNEGVNRLALLTEDIILATSIIGNKAHFENKTIDLKKLVEEIKSKYQNRIIEKGLQLSSSFAGKEAFIGDPKMIGLVIDNLVENAIKFNNQGGRIVLKVENFPPLRITVLDNGVGIEKEKLENIIGLFHRGSNYLDYTFEGEGIGLYLVNLITEYYGGHMRVFSQKGKGSTLEVTLNQKVNA